MYYIIYSLFYLLSLFPFFIIYRFSDILAFFLCHVFRYRRHIVLHNLQIAFPEKAALERKSITRQFYRNFTDSLFETVKLMSISEKQLRKRTSSNYELIESLLQDGKSINLLCGHQFNWEYGNLFYASVSTMPFVTVYLPVKNEIINRIMYKIRSRFGSIMVSTAEFGSKMHNVSKNQYALVLLADQSPALPTSGYWINFFNRPTVFLAGPERSAVRNKVAVVAFGFKKLKRGHYHFECKLLADNAGDTPSRGQLTCLYRDVLEKAIKEDPANYLWSHRRFKFEWQPEYKNKIE